MSAKTPRVWTVYVEDPAQPTEQIWLDRPEWFAWLERETTRRFCYPVVDAGVGYIVGFMTVRKEGRARGGQYWVAYRRCQGQLRRVYLGASVRLTRGAGAVGAALPRCEQSAKQWRTPRRRRGIPIRKGGRRNACADG